MSLALLRNLQAEPHRDTSNSEDAWSVPQCSTFTGGGLTLNASDTKLVFSSYHVLPTRETHSSLAWQGDRIVVVAYTVRNHHLLPPEDIHTLTRLGFALPPPTPHLADAEVV